MIIKFLSDRLAADSIMTRLRICSTVGESSININLYASQPAKELLSFFSLIRLLASFPKIKLDAKEFKLLSSSSSSSSSYYYYC